MSYEPEEPEFPYATIHRDPKDDRPSEVTLDELHSIGLTRGHLKSACEDPTTLCYGLVFEEDPDGSDVGELRGPHVAFVTGIDSVLPRIVEKLPDRVLMKLLNQYSKLHDRADADPWIGDREGWQRRLALIANEMSKRGLRPRPTWGSL